MHTVMKEHGKLRISCLARADFVPKAYALQDLVAVRPCISQAVVRTDTAHYMNRMVSLATGACALYTFPYQMRNPGPRCIKLW